MSKAEENANNAQLFLIENKLNDLVISPLWCKDKVYVSDTLMKYTESLSTENAQLREALREMVDECEFIVIPDVRTMNHLYKEEVDIDKLQDLVSKAKQLLTDKE